MTERIRNQVVHWLECLEIERIHQQDEFSVLLNEQPVTKRVDEGFCWYPIHVPSTGYAIGEQPYVVVEFRRGEKNEDNFQSGQPVRLFRLDRDEVINECKGIIHWKNKGQMKIILHLKDIPDWVFESHIGVDLLYDERTFNQMEKAMKALLKSKSNSSTYRLADIFYGEKLPAEPRDTKEERSLSGLNDSQKQAVNHALQSEDVSVIHGPPGTGKTTTLKYLIKELVSRGDQILVTAPSNAAVDWITALLHREEVNVVRIGHLSRIDNEVVDCSLESKVFSRDEAKQIKKVRLQAEEYRRQAGKYKRNFGPEERNTRRDLYREARELSDWAREIEDRIIEQVIDGAEVVSCTLSGADGRYLRGRKFKVCIIDEASQALQGACWLAMIKADRVVLAGDPYQLPPTVKSHEADKKGLSSTLLDIAVEKFPKLSLLNIQYRMNSRIMEFSNRWFYGGALKAHEEVADHMLETMADARSVIEFIDTAGCGFEEKQPPESRSYFNKDEYLIIREHLDPLLHQSFLESPTVGILSPYSAQVRFMRESMEEEQDLPFPVSIKTIDSFQGQEKDIIYISLVRSNDRGEIGFLKDYRRMNVAMTRARKKLVLIGDSATIARDRFYSRLLDYIEERGWYRTAWEFMR